jgi:hypothetical protein
VDLINQAPTIVTQSLGEREACLPVARGEGYRAFITEFGTILRKGPFQNIDKIIVYGIINPKKAVQSKELFLP